MEDLSACLAEWRAAVEAGEPGSASRDAPALEPLRQQTHCGEAVLRLAGCRCLGTGHLAALAGALPPQLRAVCLDFCGCPGLPGIEGLGEGLACHAALETLTLCLDGCEGLASLGELGQPPSALRGLTVKLGHCAELASVDGFGRGLAQLPALTTLSLDLCGCSGLASADEVGRGLAHLRCLQELSLNFSGCKRLASVDELGKGIAHLRGLTTLRLLLADCGRVAHVYELGEGVAALPALRSFQLSLEGLQGRNAALARSFDSVADFLQAHRSAVAAAVAAATATEIVEGVQQNRIGGTPQGSVTDTTGVPDCFSATAESSRTFTPASCGSSEQLEDPPPR